MAGRMQKVTVGQEDCGSKSISKTCLQRSNETDAVGGVISLRLGIMERDCGKEVELSGLLIFQPKYVILPLRKKVVGGDFHLEKDSSHEDKSGL